MSVVASIEQDMEVSKVDSIELEVVFTLQVLPEVRVVPSDPIVPLLQEIVCIGWHQSLEKDHVTDDLKGVQEDPGRQQRAGCDDWEDKEE